jgi:tRNA 2-thiouridine synthesizing protein B
MLHLVFQSPLEIATLQRIGNGDAVLFLENAVLCLLKNSVYSSQLTEMQENNRLFVLISDIETRGIAVAELVEGIEVIDYSDWVTLTTQHQPVQSWF